MLLFNSMITVRGSCFPASTPICRSGNRSKQASDKLVKLGYSNIVEFGGINNWPGETAVGME